MTVNLPLRKHSKIPIRLFNKSGPFNKSLFSDVLLNSAAASYTTLIFPGLFALVTPGCGI